MSFFKLAHEIRNAMRLFESHKQVQMVLHTANALWKTIETLHDATDIFV